MRKRFSQSIKNERRPAGCDRRRDGIVVYELIVAGPVFLILLTALVELGSLMSNMRHVNLAARAGAKTASELSTVNLGSALPADNIDLVRNAVDKVFGSAGITSCQVILEHNPGCNALMDTIRTSGACPGCSAPGTALPTLVQIPGGTVRVTVCVEATQLAPNLLSGFGLSISGRTITDSVTLPYENCP